VSRLRLPLIPTLVVAAAVAAMIALGIWQLHRRDWKEGLIARWAYAETLPPVAWPATPPADDSLLYRRADGFCLAVTGLSARAGEDRAGRGGWRHLAACRTGAEGPGMIVDIGWSTQPAFPGRYTGGRVSGVIGRDRDHRILLVADRPAPGLAPSALPDPSAEPNNHLSYAFQWFFFAATAVVIYLLALRGRAKGAIAPPPPRR
jgi:cytochrome oxidase assembly protein ShyY1